MARAGELGLRDEAAGAAGGDQVAVVGRVAARDEHDRAASCRSGTGGLRDLEAVQVGQLDVEQDDVGVELARPSRAPRRPSSASPTTSNPSASSSVRAVARKLGWSSTMRTVRAM